LRVSGPTGVKDEELKRRVEIAEEGRAQLLVSLHHNYASNPAASGPSIFYYPAGDKLHRALAEAIHSENLKVMPGKDHRIHARGFTVLANTKIPAVIMEFGFMSNPQFDAKLQDVNFRYVEADAVYRGLVKFWKAHRTEVEQFAKRYYDPTQTPSPTVHTRFAKHKH